MVAAIITHSFLNAQSHERIFIPFFKKIYRLKYHDKNIQQNKPVTPYFYIFYPYKQAVESQSYKAILHFSGNKQKAYAMNNAKEYFAELTEAYFGTNDFYPFVRAEVKQHDPGMYEVFQNVWQVNACKSNDNANLY